MWIKDQQIFLLNNRTETINWSSMGKDFEYVIFRNTNRIAKSPTFSEKRNSHFTPEKIYGVILVPYTPIMK